MSERKAFEVWCDTQNLTELELNTDYDIWRAACAWQRGKDAEIVAGTELLPGQSASQEYAYDFVARYLNDIAEAIRNQGVNDEPQ